MVKSSIDVLRLHKMVWDWRNKHQSKFPTPSPGFCLRFAAEEAGEVMRAWIHSNQPVKFVRNSKAQTDIFVELTDMVFMLLSAIPPEIEDNIKVLSIQDSSVHYLGFGVDEIVSLTCDLLQYADSLDKDNSIGKFYNSWVHTAYTINKIICLIDAYFDIHGPDHIPLGVQLQTTLSTLTLRFLDKPITA